MEKEIDIKNLQTDTHGKKQTSKQRMEMSKLWFLADWGDFFC